MPDSKMGDSKMADSDAAAGGAAAADSSADSGVAGSAAANEQLEARIKELVGPTKVLYGHRKSIWETEKPEILTSNFFSKFPTEGLSEYSHARTKICFSEMCETQIPPLALRKDDDVFFAMQTIDGTACGSKCTNDRAAEWEAVGQRLEVFQRNDDPRLVQTRKALGVIPGARVSWGADITYTRIPTRMEYLPRSDMGARAQQRILRQFHFNRLTHFGIHHYVVDGCGSRLTST
jgi:hypothetical protein